MIRRSSAIPVKTLCGVGAVFLMVLWLASPTLMLVSTALGVGWLRHLVWMQEGMGTVLLGVAATATLVIVVAYLRRREVDSTDEIATEDKSLSTSGSRFPARLAGTGAAFLALVATSSLLGIVQQASKLLRSPRPLTIIHPAYNPYNASRNNLKQIGLAAHNYESRFRTFPGAGTFTDLGAGHHSWMTFLLPYVDQAPLYRQIDLATDWTSPANAELFRQPVGSFSYPFGLGVPESPPGGLPLAGYAGNIRVLPPDRSLSLSQITDGTSNTILAGEVIAGLRPWGDPANLRDPARGVNHAADGFGAPWSRATSILMSDGAVRRIPNDIDPDVLRRLGTPNGGEPVELPSW